MNESDIERFWGKVDVRSKDECWEWLGRKDLMGYGQFDIDRMVWKAHRAMYRIMVGYPFGMVLHKCDNTSYVNPNHIYLGTHSDNVMDALDRSSPGRPPNLYAGEVWLIKKIYSTGKFSQLFISKMFKVSRPSISLHIRDLYPVKEDHKWWKEGGIKCQKSTS